MTETDLTTANLTRSEIERMVEPIIRECREKFGDFPRPITPKEEIVAATKDTLRPDVRRVSLILWLARPFLGSEMSGEGLEVGCGFGYLMFPMAKLYPHVHWTAVDHPERRYFDQKSFHETLRLSNCSLVGANITSESLPFSDNHFSVVTFSEIMEHLPVERLNFVLSEVSRVTRPGGILIASSPNQASFENRLSLLRGKSIFELPNEVAHAKGIFGHIRLYTPAEVEMQMKMFGFSLQRCILESNNSGYRGYSSRSIYGRLYRMYERMEGRVRMLRSMGDTWYAVFRKGSS